MPSHGVAARLLSSSRWNLIAFAVSVLANFLSLPIAIAAIGIDAFGAAGLALAAYAPFTLVGTVIGQALVRELAPRMAREDHDACARTMSAASAIGLIGCVLVVMTLWLAGAHLMPWLTRSDDARVDWSAAMLVCGLGWALQQCCLVLQATLMAAQNFARLAIASGLGALVAALCVVGASRAWPGAMGFLLGTAAGFASTLLLLTLMLRGSLGWLFRPRRWRDTELAALVRFGKWQGAAHFAGAVGNQMDRYVLGMMAPLAVVGQFNVAMRLHEVVYMGVLKATEVLFPHFSITADDALDRRAEFFARASWLLALLSAMALAPLIPLAEGLVTLWVDAASAAYAAPILRTLASAGVIGCGINVYSYYAMATGKAPRLAKLAALHSLLLVSSTLLLIWLWGPLAAGVGYLVANLMRLALVVHFGSGDFAPELPPTKMLQCAVGPLLAGLAVAWLVTATGPAAASSWGWLALDYLLLAIAVGMAGLLVAGLTKGGRAMIVNTVASGRRIVSNRP